MGHIWGIFRGNRVSSKNIAQSRECGAIGRPISTPPTLPSCALLRTLQACQPGEVKM